ncbi:VOC family protein [Labrenzia sp. CE80]|uniref:VOC family protein n=1 Tax=Labrenzia sp. CE80 TaxID=1788986 RepID=UPI001389EF12|nr:VOC family protein [Labrenzia sp. CE80]
MNTNVTDTNYPAVAVPVLFSADLRRTSMFYSDALGFAVYRESDGLRVRRSQLDLKITLMTNADLMANLSVVFRVDEIGKLHEEYRGRSLPNLGQVKHGICGKPQFSLTDPDGNSLYFVETA